MFLQATSCPSGLATATNKNGNFKIVRQVIGNIHLADLTLAKIYGALTSRVNVHITIGQENEEMLTCVKAYTIFKGRLRQLLSEEYFFYLYGHSKTTGTSS